MNTYTKEELSAILESHAKWLRLEDGGVRANLSGAYLSGADLSRADLSRANLSGAYLSGADLYGANLSGVNLSGAVYKWAQVAFTGHGECGRMLTAVIHKEGEATVYQCGCFSGSIEDLQSYITNGAENHKASRTLAMDYVTRLLAV